MDPKFKAGDVVTIKKDLDRSKDRDIPFGICENMEKYAGKQAVIKEVFSNAKNIEDYPVYPDFDEARYRLNIDECKWSWANVMFEESKSIKPSKDKKEEDLLLCCICF